MEPDVRKPVCAVRGQTALRLPLLAALGVLWIPGGPSAGGLHAEPRDASAVVWVGQFESRLAPWREVQLRSGQRPNTFTLLRWDEAHAVEVVSRSSMSLLARPLQVDLRVTPVLCWRWRVQASLSTADMTRRDGDDYAARVYVSFRLPATSLGLGLRAQLAIARSVWGPDVPDAALNYVWDNRQPVGTRRPNVYTDRTQMVVQRSGDQEAGRWVWERADVQSDVLRHFGAGAEPVQLAVTADTDNTQAVARAGFADLHFVAADTPCQTAAGAGASAER